jgi:hypothetical protein
LEHKTKGVMSIKKAQNENTKAVMQTGENFWAEAQGIDRQRNLVTKP